MTVMLPRFQTQNCGLTKVDRIIALLSRALVLERHCLRACQFLHICHDLESASMPATLSKIPFYNAFDHRMTSIPIIMISKNHTDVDFRKTRRI